MRIQLSDHFTYKRLIRFVASSIFMMIYTSLYGIVDGFFVSNYVGKTPFAAVNLIMPIIMGVTCIGFMVGTGGSAVVALALGEGKREQANQYFSMLVYTVSGFSILLSIIGALFVRPISAALGAEGELLEYCVIYGRILFVSQTAFILQSVFQSFFVTAEKPGLSLKVSFAAGFTNMILDYVFIAVFGWGIAGAALATAAGELVGGGVPLIYFLRKNDSLLRLVKAPFNARVLWKTCTNGSSEMVTNLSTSLVNILYNFQLMKIAGENGVAAYGIIMYINFIFMGVYFGYSIGSAPVISYDYGSGNTAELKNLFHKSIVLMGLSGALLTLLAELFAAPLINIFAGYDAELSAMTCYGFKLYSLAFIFMGFSVWGSAFFTALGNGGVSAAISFLRTLIFQVSMIIILPLFLGVEGIWLAIAAAEILALVVTLCFFFIYRKRYRYA